MTPLFHPDRPLVGISLKMYFSATHTRQYLQELADQVGSHDAVQSGAVQMMVFPGFVALPWCQEILGNTAIRFGAQDVHWEENGAYTGEVSVVDLEDVGATAVEIGHMERITIFGETPEVISKKVTVSLRRGITPVVCVGEGKHSDYDQAASDVLAQVDAFVGPARSSGLTGQVVYAYEPYWAIGADKPASPDYVVEVSRRIRDGLGQTGTDILIYGGTAGPGLLPDIYPAAGGLFLGRLAHDVKNVHTVVSEAAALV